MNKYWATCRRGSKNDRKIAYGSYFLLSSLINPHGMKAKSTVTSSHTSKTVVWREN